MAAKEKTQDIEHLDHDRSLAKDHPVGTSVGAAGGAVAGATAGAAMGGPVAKGAAHAVNHDEEDAYWRENHVRQPYHNPEHTYEDYGPAYRMGWESRARYDEGNFDTYEPSFRNDWDESYRGQSRLTWAEARHAARAGWERFERKLPGEADRDGR